MTHWIDITLDARDEATEVRLRELGPVGRDALRADLCAFLGVSDEDLSVAVLRMLIERARPFTLPARVWRRPLTATWSVRSVAQEHLDHIGVAVTEDRLDAMQGLYASFAAGRVTIELTERILREQKFACRICGLQFFSEELAEWAIPSPHGDKHPGRADKLKPHWAGPEYRKVVIDHIWPVSTYGDNSDTNVAVLCSGCNTGKSNYAALHQTKAFVGMPYRREMARMDSPVHFDTFYAQLRRRPRCEVTGRTWRETELTVRLRSDQWPPVLDNLITVAVDAP